MYQFVCSMPGRVTSWTAACVGRPIRSQSLCGASNTRQYWTKPLLIALAHCFVDDTFDAVGSSTNEVALPDVPCAMTVPRMLSDPGPEALVSVTLTRVGVPVTLPTTMQS